MVAHAFNPSTWEAEAGGFLSSRPAWSTEWVPGQPGLHRETLSRKTKNKKQTKKNQQKRLPDNILEDLEAAQRKCQCQSAFATQRERERETETERQRHRERDRDRKRQRDRNTERDTRTFVSSFVFLSFFLFLNYKEVDRYTWVQVPMDARRVLTVAVSHPLLVLGKDSYPLSHISSPSFPYLFTPRRCCPPSGCYPHLCCLVLCQLDTKEEKLSTEKMSPLRFAYRPSCRASSSLTIDVKRPSPLWVVPPLGRWF
jgi:hypothetical protein